MLEEYTLIAHHGGEYDAQTAGKEYVVNMMGNRRTLHKNHNQTCYCSSGMYAFIPFDDWEEAKHFQKEHNVVFCKCGNCFPDEGNK